ncbi:hypothetical protein MRB53_042233 [Persea americana]|nr:hypothetical protein MRB53_042233 [Persea americana]
MTHNFSSSGSTVATERRAFTGLPMSNNKQVHGPNTQVSQKIRNFFRISSSSHEPKEKERDVRIQDGSVGPKSDLKSTIRQSRFIPHIGRNRSATVASEGNALEDSLSPTAQVNPYFQHQGPPTLRHHNDNSVPPSPPDTPNAPSLLANASGTLDLQSAAGKEEMARKLRRVASAPNAQGLFTTSKSTERPVNGQGALGTASPSRSRSNVVDDTAISSLLPIPTVDGTIPKPGQIRESIAFRRTYSSNSIKVRNVEVGPGSFDKIKLIGKGDVGKVYLVREKKSSRLYAMKGAFCCFLDLLR